MLHLLYICGLVGNVCSFHCSLSLKFCYIVLIRTVGVTHVYSSASYNIAKSACRLNVRQTENRWFILTSRWNDLYKKFFSSCLTQKIHMLCPFRVSCSLSYC